MVKLMIGRVSAKRSKIMKAVLGRNTKPEIELRKALWRAGLRYRLHVKNLPGRPDIVFPSAKVAVFVDGDFWHGKNWDRRKAQKQFRVRKKFWIAKIERNIERDRENNRTLGKLGWLVFRFWESEIKESPEKIVARVLRAVQQRSH